MSDSTTNTTAAAGPVSHEKGLPAEPGCSGKARRGPGPWTVVAIAVIVLAVGAHGARLYSHSLVHEDTDNAFVEGIAVQVSPRVAGHVVRLLVRDNQHVRAGDPLVEIDAREIRTRLEGAQASVKAAEARVRSAELDLATVRKTATAARDQERSSLEAAVAGVETARVRLATARTAETQAGSRLVSARSQVERAQAEQEAAEAEAGRARSDLGRFQSLFKKNAITAVQMDQYAAIARSSAAMRRAAQLRVATAEAQVSEALAALDTAVETTRQARVGIREAEAREAEARARLSGADIVDERVARVAAERDRSAADLEQLKSAAGQARQDLADARVLAPQSGTVTKRAVEVGSYVRPGQALMGLVADEKWVIANFRETQLARMRPGQPVSVRVDAFSQRKLEGVVDSIQLGTGARFSLLPAENATGNYVKVVQRVPVKIVFAGPIPADLPLALGMSVVPEVTVD